MNHSDWIFDCKLSMNLGKLYSIVIICVVDILNICIYLFTFAMHSHNININKLSN